MTRANNKGSAEQMVKKTLATFMCSPTPQHKARFEQALDWYAEEWIEFYTTDMAREERKSELRRLDGFGP